MSEISGRDVVEAWIIEYAAAMRYSGVLKEVISSQSSPLPLAVRRVCPNASLHLAFCSLHDIVNHNQVNDLDMAIALINEIYGQSESSVELKLYVRLVSALKMLSVFRVLRTDDPLITFEKLNAYFPRAAFQHPKASREFSESITKRMAHFRAQFLQLTTSKTKKEEFFAHRFEQDYGEEFLCVVRRLCKEFCRRTQPSTTAIKEILNSPVGSKLISDLRAEKCIEINALLDACEVQQSHLSENEVLSLFHKIRSM